ncbi:MAG TPA: hypothetical protein VD931_08965 [Baekduia sp.]|nr:hypothetical protein [Baekduia sp.]
MVGAARNQVTRKVVIVGPGKIGCGFLAPLFAQAGWDVVLAARTVATAGRIRRAGHFLARTTPDAAPHRVRTGAVTVGTAAFDHAVATADLVATAVGSDAIPALGEPLARALASRGRPIDVWAVENADVAAALRTAVRAAAAREGRRLPAVGFAGAIAWAAVAHGDFKEPGRPEFVGDGCGRLQVDGRRLITPLPALPGVEATADYEGALHAKRLVFGAGHALCAYLGARRGHRFVHEAVADPEIGPLVREAVEAADRALGGACDPDTVLERFANAALQDPVRRVARDPLRKLSAHGPLVGAARIVQDATGAVPSAFAAGIAAALRYDDPADDQAFLLTELRASSGTTTVVRDVCGIAPGDPLHVAVARRLREPTERPAPHAA